MQAEFLALWRKDGRIDDMVENWQCAIDALCAVFAPQREELGLHLRS